MLALAPPPPIGHSVGGRAIVRVHQIQKRRGQKFGRREIQRRDPGWIQTSKVPIETDDAEQVMREIEERIEELARLPEFFFVLAEESRRIPEASVERREFIVAAGQRPDRFAAREAVRVFREEADTAADAAGKDERGHDTTADTENRAGE